ncbi:hypothetical protein VUN82_23720 [Micrococcaceae bacterium Sec5.1]
MNRRAIAVFSVVAALGLTGCSAQAGLKALDREASAEDKLPESVSLTGVDLNVEAGTARLLATYDDVKYYGAKSSTSGTVCLIAVPVGLPERWRAGCAAVATSEQIVTISGGDGTEAKLINDGVDANRPEYRGWTQVHENVLVSKPSRY